MKILSTTTTKKKLSVKRMHAWSKNKQVIEVTTSSCERKQEIGEKKKKKKNKRVNK